MNQTGLTEFSSPADEGAVDPEKGTETRPADVVTAEAEAVAGTDSGAVDAVIDVDEARFPESTGTVEMMITQVDYTVEGSGSDEYPVIHVFGRTPAADGNDEAEHVRVLGVEPYFYVPTEALDFDPVEEFDAVIGVSETDTEGERYESIRGQQVTRIVTRTPRDVGQLRDEFGDTYEADILFPDRFLVDNGISAGMRVEERRLDDGRLQVSQHHLEPADVTADIRVNTFDIEVEDRSGFPEEGEEPIVCLTSHDSYSDEYIVWLYEAPTGDGEIPDGLPDYEPLSESINLSVRTYTQEAAMLDAFVSYLDDTSPDLTTGWNFEDFDMPYLLDRMEELDPGVSQDLSVERLSRIEEVWRSGWGGPDVKGGVVFDLLYAYKRTMFTELESYRLDAVGERELDAGKERYPGDVGDLWEDDPERLLEYNLRDVELCIEIDHKQAVIEFWNEARKIVGCRIQDAPTPGDAVDMYVLHQAYGEFVLPTKGQRAGEEFEGGAVFDPITGVREMVSVLDLKCFSGDTEVATPSGLRNIQTLDIGDPVYTLNPSTFECEIKPVVDTQSYENQYGELHHVSGDTHDLKITENHRVLLADSHNRDELGPADYEFAEYRDIPETGQFAFPTHDPMPGVTRDTFQLLEDVSGGHVVVQAPDGFTASRAAVPVGVETDPASTTGTEAQTQQLAATEQQPEKHLVPLDTFRENRDHIETQADEIWLKYDSGHAELPVSFEMDDWLELIGRVVSTGSFTDESPEITLHQQDEHNCRQIEDLLGRMQVHYTVDEDVYTISDRYLHEWFIHHCGAEQSRLPEWVFDLDGSQLETLLDAVAVGDGARAEDEIREFWTQSDHLKTSIVRLAIRCGERPTVSKQSDDTWHISLGKRGSMRKATATTESHDGDVHCITAQDNHVVLAGRNGHLQWVGQSLYPMSMVTINASPETIVDNPEAYDGETYRAPDGTRFRKEPDGMMREMVDELLVEREELKGERNRHDPGSEKYEKYDRQQQSVKVIMNCFTPDTDVLTPDGIRSITDLGVGDEVYSLNPGTTEMEVKSVEETHAYPEYRDELIDIETPSTDLQVTPNHRMLVRKSGQNGDEWDDYQFVEAGNLDDTSTYHFPHDWDGPDGEPLTTVDLTEFVDADYQLRAETDETGHTQPSEVGSDPGTIQMASGEEVQDVFSAEDFTEHSDSLDETSEFLIRRESADTWIPPEYDGDDFLELLARYITDGSVCVSDPTDSGRQLQDAAARVQLDQDNSAATDGGITVETQPSSQEPVGKLLDRMGLEYHADETGYQFTSRLLGELLEETCGVDSHTKQIPEFVFERSRRQKRAFFEMLTHDGHRSASSWRYSTASEDLRDDILRLCAHLGMTAEYTQGDGGISRISVSEAGEHTLQMDRDSATRTADDGVYCVTVADNHTLLAGRNGTFQWVGQSLYGVSGWEQFRLYDKDNAAAITAMGRRVIEFTEEAANEIDYDVTYGDSVTGERPLVVRDGDGRVRVLPAADLFERADRRETLAVTADGGAVEGTSIGKEYASLPEWEALSLADDETAEWQPITEVVRHKTDDEVVTLQHELGESTTTTDHSYVVSKDGEFVERPPDAVSEPLRIPNVPPVEPVETIDLFELFNGDIQEHVDRGTAENEPTNHPAKRVYSDDDHVWFGQPGQDDADSSIKLQREIDLTGPDGRSFVRLLAASIAHGNTTIEATAGKGLGASIAESRREWQDELQTDSDRLAETTQLNSTASDTSDERPVTNQTQSETTESADGEINTLQVITELSAVVFGKFTGDTPRGTQIPSFVYHIEEELQELFVETLVDREGSQESSQASDEDTDRHFDFETPSRELAAGISLLLTQREYDHSLHYHDETDSYRIQPSGHSRSGCEPVLTERDYDGYVYDLSVAENDNFVDGVGGLVLHNTDSVMLSLTDVGDDSVEVPEPVREAHPELSESELETTQAAIDASVNIESYINDRYDEFASEELDAAKHRFQIEFEKLYRRFFQAGKKKRYAGHIVWKEGKHVDDVDITGFEYQRSDIAGITKRVQREVIDRIVTGEDLEADLDGVKSFLSDEIDAFLEGNMPLDEVGIPGGIGKRLGSYETATAQVRGAKYANLLFGTNFGRGSKPKRLYLESVHPDFWQRVETKQKLDPQSDPLYGEFKREVENGDGVICFEYADQIPEEFNVDWEKMLEKTLKRPISRVIEAVGTSWEEVKTGQKQSGLEQYF